MRIAALTLALFWSAPINASTQSPLEGAAIDKSVQTGEEVLSKILFSDVVRDAEILALTCASRVMLRHPSTGLAALDRKNPGLMAYVLHDVGETLREDFGPVWEKARADFAAQLARYPSEQRNKLRKFFQSSTGIKLLGYSYMEIPGMSESDDPSKGFEQCQTKPLSSDVFDAVMTDEDVERLSAFPADQASQITPNHAIRLAGQFGVQTASTFMTQFRGQFESLVDNARTKFAAGNRLNGAH